uniref:Uncharacterized protein n=1 Tax=Arundo donax TaxID=35708 RepID=A0A0A9BLY0_ARUDO
MCQRCSSLQTYHTDDYGHPFIYLFLKETVDNTITTDSFQVEEIHN